MGTINHRAIIVTSWDEVSFDKAITKAKELNLLVISHENKVTNGHRTFLICPCGSKERWQECDDHIEKLSLFKEWANGQAKDNDNPDSIERFYISAVEVIYGDADPEITDHNQGQLFNV